MARDQPATVSRTQLKNRLLSCFARWAGSPLPDAEFEELALSVFEHQLERNPIYREYCLGRGKTPRDISSWLDIPAVPTDAFKAAPLLCGPVTDAATIFRTSGTTRGTERRGNHYFLDTDLYEASLRTTFPAHLLPDLEKVRILSLVPAATEVPDSSLSFMISRVMEEHASAGSGYFADSEGVLSREFLSACGQAVADEVPTMLIGTSFAFVHVLEDIARLERPLRLPAGSRAMDTGGFKGRSREVTRSDLYDRIEKLLGIPVARVVNEYGMTEMSSQFYDGVAGAAPPLDRRRHVGPGWVRSVAVSPENLEPLPAGEVGVLRHLDLANLDSVAAIQTADLGSVTNDGIDLKGRLAGAQPRGCSLAMEELLAAIDSRRGR